MSAVKLTEAEWQLVTEFRRDWNAFCDCDAVSPDFGERMEAAGFVELVPSDTLPEDPFLWEKYGDSPPTLSYALTEAGRAALAQGQDNG